MKGSFCNFLITCSTVLIQQYINLSLVRADPQKQKPNLLYIITDQQRYDAIGLVQKEMERYAGKTTIKTPHLDKLLLRGAYFRQAYAQTPVCGPARSTLKTGCTIERTGIQTNDLVNKEINELESLFRDKISSIKTLDQVLTENHGYQVEYYGKWHAPVDYYEKHNSTGFSLKYNDYNYYNNSFLLNTDEENWSEKYQRYLKYDKSMGNLKIEFGEGDQMDTYTKLPYSPITLDSRFGLPTNTNIRDTKNYPELEGRSAQPNIKGVSSVSDDFTPSGYNTDIALMALDRLASSVKPFALTVSFHSPHAPFVGLKKYADYYLEHKHKLWVAPSITDRFSNSAYVNRHIDMGYNNKAKVQEWVAVYYAAVEEIDTNIGKLLDKLDEHGLTQNTLIVFTSDHGEMLGAHALRGKNTLYEESVRVPLFLSMPGIIEPRTIVDESVSHLNLFSTILDYLGCNSSDESDGNSLRPLIENTAYNKEHDEDFVVSEWDYRSPSPSSAEMTRELGKGPNFMIKKGNYKLIITKLSGSSELDMMFDLKRDPYEMNNLLGRKGRWASNDVIGKAEHLKALLYEWMMDKNGIGYYGSDPAYTDSLTGPFSDGIKSGRGDLIEIYERRKWKLLNLWVSDRILEFGRPVQDGDNYYVRNEYLYFGHTTSNTLKVNKITITGKDASLFTVHHDFPKIMERNEYDKVKISFRSSTLPRQNDVDARIILNYSGSAQRMVQISMNSEVSTHSPSVTSSPTVVRKKSPTGWPTFNPSLMPTTTIAPSKEPTPHPSSMPITIGPSIEASHGPSESRITAVPSNRPSTRPSDHPTTTKPTIGKDPKNFKKQKKNDKKYKKRYRRV